MFKIIRGAPNERSSQLEHAAVVDVQLVGDDLANDVSFTNDMVGGRSARTSDAYTYCSLSDRLSPSEIESIRAFILGLLSELAQGQSFLLFCAGKVFSSESALSEEEDYVAFAAHSGDQLMNGQVEIAEVQCADLKYYLDLFCHYDGVKGVLMPPGNMRLVLGSLLLSDPVPTTDRSFITGEPNISAVAATLKHGSFLFEEVKNGTRLRIVSISMPVRSLEECVEGYVEQYLRRTPSTPSRSTPSRG